MISIVMIMYAFFMSAVHDLAPHDLVSIFVYLDIYRGLDPSIMAHSTS